MHCSLQAIDYLIHFRNFHISDDNKKQYHEKDYSTAIMYSFAGYRKYDD